MYTVFVLINQFERNKRLVTTPIHYMVNSKKVVLQKCEFEILNSKRDDGYLYK